MVSSIISNAEQAYISRSPVLKPYEKVDELVRAFARIKTSTVQEVGKAWIKR